MKKEIMSLETWTQIHRWTLDHRINNGEIQCVFCDSKTEEIRKIITYSLWKASTVTNGTGLIMAHRKSDLDEIVKMMVEQLELNTDLLCALMKWRKRPYHQMTFNNGFIIHFRPSGHDGVAFRGLYVETFAIAYEAQENKNNKQWIEFWRTIKPGCIAKIYSVS